MFWHRVSDTQCRAVYADGLVTSSTRTLDSGEWYVVTKDVVIENGANIAVDGSANLILMDDVSLTIRKVANGEAAIKVSKDNRLAIFGLQHGMGRILATGGTGAAGIGGGACDECGTITINGGMVTATGGKNALGIGVGSDGSGGTVTLGGDVSVIKGGA